MMSIIRRRDSQGGGTQNAVQEAAMGVAAAAIVVVGAMQLATAAVAIAPKNVGSAVVTADFVFGEVVVAAVACVLVRASARDRLLLGAEAARPGRRDEFLAGPTRAFSLFSRSVRGVQYIMGGKTRGRERARAMIFLS